MAVALWSYKGRDGLGEPPGGWGIEHFTVLITFNNANATQNEIAIHIPQIIIELENNLIRQPYLIPRYEY